MLEAAEVQLPAHLLEDAEEVAAAGGRRVQPDRVEILAQRLRHPDGLELLVLQGVDEGHPPHLGIHHLVEGAQRLHGVAEHEHEGVGDGAHGIGVDELGGLGHRHPVAAADEGVALDHGRQRGMHAARPEGDHLPLARRPLAARRLGGDAGGLAEEAEQRGLVLRPVEVVPLDHQHRLVRARRWCPRPWPRR